MILFCVGTFLFWSSLYVYVPVLSVYARDMGASMGLVGLIIGAYGLTQLLLRIPLGFYSDVIGRRKPFVLMGIVACGVGCLGLVLSPSPWFLVMSRAVLGIGAATWVAFSVMFAGYFALDKLAHAMAIIGFVNGAAQAVSGLIGGYISQLFGTTYAFCAGIGLAILGMLVMLSIKEEVKPRPSQMSVDRLWTIARTPALVVSAGLALVFTFANFSITQSFMPIYARSIGASDAQLGIISTIVVLANTGAVIFGARAASVVGDRTLMALSLLLMAVSVAAVPATPTITALIAVQALSQISRGISQPSLMSMGIRALPSHERATAMGVYQAVYSIGMFFGPPLSGLVADSFGLPSVFFVTAAFCVVAMLWALSSPALRPFVKTVATSG